MNFDIEEMMVLLAEFIENWKSAYTCTACIEDWLEESGQVESEG